MDAEERRKARELFESVITNTYAFSDFCRALRTLGEGEIPRAWLAAAVGKYPDARLLISDRSIHVFRVRLVGAPRLQRMESHGLNSVAHASISKTNDSSVSLIIDLDDSSGSPILVVTKDDSIARRVGELIPAFEDLSVVSEERLSEEESPAQRSETEGTAGTWLRYCPYCGAETVQRGSIASPYCERCARYIPSVDSGSTGQLRSRASVGLKVICVLWIIGSAISVFDGISVASIGVEYGVVWVSLLGVLQIALGVAQFVAAFGLWGLRYWAWRTAVALLWISLVLRGISVLMGDLAQLVGIAVSIAFLVYFYHRRTWFRL